MKKKRSSVQRNHSPLQICCNQIKKVNEKEGKKERENNENYKVIRQAKIVI